MDPIRSAFVTLKPICVRLSEAVVHLDSAQRPLPDVESALADLLRALRTIQQAGPHVDHRLADYIFFPLSNIFRERQRFPSRVLEKTLQCLQLLLSSGWDSALDGALAQQLLILLTFLAGGSPNAAPTATQPSAELQFESFTCELLLFRALAKSPRGNRAKLLETGNIPSIGHAVTVLLDAARNAPAPNVQLVALDTLDALCGCVHDRLALANFLPGIVTTLTKILTPSTKQRQPYKALVTSLQTLTRLIKSVFADNLVFPLPKDGDRTVDLGEAWLKATAAQVKLALANVMRLHKHDRREDCPQSLSDSVTLTTETLFILEQIDGDASSIGPELARIVLPNADLVNSVRSSLYNWLRSMPRIMLSNDEDAKTRILGQVAASFKLIQGTDVDMSIIDESILASLQDGMLGVATGSLAGAPPVEQLTSLEAPLSHDLQLAYSTKSIEFPPIFNFRSAQTGSLSSMSSLVRRLATSDNSVTLAQEALDQARCNGGSMQVINIWLALNLLRSRAISEDSLDVSQFLTVDISTSTDAPVLEDLYDMAINLLVGDDASEDATAWQLQALALEAVALQASVQQADFRPDLVDALYPVVHHLGSATPFLRHHAALALNSIASSCAYSSAQELLVENADYLVNAIGMKLNAFDIEPQAPQVLRMLAKLCGPKIVPYLDDIVDGVFEALDCFHRYPSLVDLLFSALGAVVEESGKAEVLKLDAVMGQKQPQPPNHFKQPVRAKTISDVTARLREKRKKREQEAEDTMRIAQGLPEQTPQRPWTELRSPDKSNENETGPPTAPPEDDKPPPLSKPYLTALRIATSTQYHLSSPAAHTRLSLLRTLLAAIPYLSRHEDSFLPLVNVVWPSLVPRLRDSEVYVICGTLEVMGALTVGAGDFMSGRIEGIWGEVRTLWAMANPEIGKAESFKGAPLTIRTANSISKGISSQEIVSITTKPQYTNLTQPLPEEEPIISISSTLAPPTSKNDLLTPISSTASTAAVQPVPSFSLVPQEHRPKYEATTILRLRDTLVVFLTTVLTHSFFSSHLPKGRSMCFFASAVESNGELDPVADAR
ncbi:hypothetical protein FH972_026676 [Carpinus fangiana]|uniref:Uncharacterized protein n=1 Tax=Carpinus fangiana TaxID=176857 RepID=A0A5N6L4Q4_9ROSI|nr:hypothetical protein FH972_026676 [Carpinus fangiana]